MKRRKHSLKLTHTKHNKGWRKCGIGDCTFNARSARILGQHRRRVHGTNGTSTQKAEEKLIREAIAPVMHAKRRGRPKHNPPTIDGLDRLIIAVRERSTRVSAELEKMDILQREQAQLDHELNTLMQAKAALEGVSNPAGHHKKQ